MMVLVALPYDFRAFKERPLRAGLACSHNGHHVTVSPDYAGLTSRVMDKALYLSRLLRCLGNQTSTNCRSLESKNPSQAVGRGQVFRRNVFCDAPVEYKEITVDNYHNFI